MSASRSAWAAVLGIAAVQLAGCATPGPILKENVGAIRTGVIAAREQARLTIEDANGVILQQAIERKLDDDGTPTIAEADFPTAVTSEDVEAWRNAFDVLDGYGAALQKLVDPGLAQGTGDAIAQLGTDLNGGSANARLPGPVVGLFATFGQALVAASAECKATRVMQRVDPAFSGVVAGMADALGDGDSAGLRGIVRTNWGNALSRMRSDYSERIERKAGRPARAVVLRRFVAAARARDAQVASIAQLRASLLALGEAHSAAAKGETGTAVFWIERIGSWLDDVQRRAKEIDDAKEEQQ